MTLIFPLILYLLLLMIYSLLLSYLMLLKGWDDGFCGWWKKAEGSCPLPTTEELTEYVPALWEMGIPSSTLNSLLPNTVKCHSVLETLSGGWLSGILAKARSLQDVGLLSSQ